MPEMLRHRNLRGVDISRNKCLYRASLAGAQAASALAFGINGNTAASIAMTASLFSSNICQRSGHLKVPCNNSCALSAKLFENCNHNKVDPRGGSRKEYLCLRTSLRSSQAPSRPLIPIYWG